MNKYLKWALIRIENLVVVGFITYQVLNVYTKTHSPQETSTFFEDLGMLHRSPFQLTKTPV